MDWITFGIAVSGLLLSLVNTVRAWRRDQRDSARFKPSLKLRLGPFVGQRYAGDAMQAVVRVAVVNNGHVKVGIHSFGFQHPTLDAFILLPAFGEEQARPTSGVLDTGDEFVRLYEYAPAVAALQSEGITELRAEDNTGEVWRQPIGEHDLDLLMRYGKAHQQ